MGSAPDRLIDRSPRLISRFAFAWLGGRLRARAAERTSRSAESAGSFSSSRAALARALAAARVCPPARADSALRRYTSRACWLSPRRASRVPRSSCPAARSRGWSVSRACRMPASSHVWAFSGWPAARAVPPKAISIIAGWAGRAPGSWPRGRAASSWASAAPRSPSSRSDSAMPMRASISIAGALFFWAAARASPNSVRASLGCPRARAPWP